MKIKVAATQMTCTWETEENITKATKLIKQAADEGANIILLQELFHEALFLLDQVFFVNTVELIQLKHLAILEFQPQSVLKLEL